MKFIHIADMHFDVPFSSLNKGDFADQRRIKQREIFDRIIEYIKENNIEHLFIAGDFFEQESVRLSTIEYCNNQFKRIPNTQIWITPGNHDPYIKNSYYNSYSWNDNVTIFKGEVECIKLEDVNIYGFGFTDFYCESDIGDLVLDDKTKLNILITHADLDANRNSDKNYNPVSYKNLKEKGFDYIALGHIHHTNFNENERIIYPGSTMSLGFDEDGKHGMIVGEITKESYKIQYIELDKEFYKDVELDVSNVFDKESLVNEINKLEVDKQYVYKVNLTGTRNFDINVDDIYKYVEIENIMKLKNETVSKYKLEDMATENNLKGIFIREMLSRYENADDKEKEKIQKAIEIGLDVLE